MTTIDFTNAELLTLSAALQVYHNVAPEFGRDAFTHHEEHFPDDAVTELEANMVALANRVNRILSERFPVEDWQDAIDGMTDEEARIAILGTHACMGSERFRDMTITVLETLVSHMDAGNN